MSSRGPRWGVRIDYIAEILIGIFLVTILFGGLGGLLGSDQASFNLSVFLILMQLSAVGLWIVSKTYTVDPRITKAQFNEDTKYIIFSLAAFFALNIGVRAASSLFPPIFQGLFALLSQPKLSLATAGKFTTVMISIPEESLWRGWGAPWFARKTGLFGGAILSGAGFAMYHLFVYGDSIPSLIIVFVAGVIAGFIALKRGRLYTTLAMHFLANFITVGFS